MASIFNRFARMFRAPTPEEKDQKALDQRRCPDCGSKNLLVGPTGGACVNVACDDCHMEFNILNMFGNLRLMDRMGELSADRAKLYGIDLEVPEPTEKLKALMRDRSAPWGPA